ncbi:eukaryotic translation initiation factor 5B-like protein [Leptotrombidium deliense]|uniref:Eukaryotic translation initiation factor 5B n=1 Tax=Leptotrombidium deliense TaxID=299467 RepID=A0A443SN33_9ACAR|nr:eukaryotic translation initiation factor 5B-like protein [Leptotrombidium deliense]
MLAELALEIEGKKAPEKPKEVVPTDINKEDKKEEKPHSEKTEVKDDVKQSEQKAAKDKKKKKKQADKPETNKIDNSVKAEANATKVVEKEVTTEEVVDDDEDKDKEKTGKKDKKKNKKDAKAEKEAKKGPGKKQIAMMQEALKKLQEEEERQKREEEERIRREEEAERLREEKLRLEKERKEKKKQKEKERKERLKKEGKLLTAKQKADMQRAKASLALLQQQGRVVIGGRDKVKKQDSTESKSEGKDELDHAEPDDENGKVSHQSDDTDSESDDDVNETWEDLTEVNEEKTGKERNISGQNASANKRHLNDTEKIVKKPHICEENSVTLPSPDIPTYRSPVLCVLGHVDTGKTKLLDYLRKTHVQDNEAGGITQQIGATFVPPTAIEEQCRGTKKPTELSLPGLLIIDTPGHESFSNLRSRGSSLCDIAILVIDIMHGLEPQTIESINLLKSRKTPFIVALNKIDRLYDWRSNPKKDIEDVIKSQQTNAKLEFQQRVKEIIVQLNEQSLNAALYYENNDPRSFVSLVPTSAVVGDGMGNLINLIIHYCQTMMSKKLLYEAEKLEATVLEVKAIPGLGTTIDVILVNGKLREGDRIVLAGHDGPIVTSIRSLLVPQPLRELRVKSPYQELKVVYGSMGVKVAGHDLDKAVAGLELYVAKNDADTEQYKSECWRRFGEAMRAIKCSEKGVYVQASTLGSLEALLEFLKVSKIPYCGVRIGPVVKRDIMKASIMLETAPDYAVVLAFDVKVERDAQELADQLGVKIFTAEIIYHLFDKFTAYREDLKQKRKEQYKHIAVFPCKIRILPQFIFNTRDPIVVGVSIEDGVLIPGTPLAVPSKGNVEIGRVSSIEINHKQVESARRGQEVCIKIEHVGGDAPKLYGRHFDHEDMVVSRISRESIDALKEYFRDEMTKSDWALIIELKKHFEIM